MSAQATKKTSKKNKLSPNDSELESQFYVAQRAKSSRVSKPSKLSHSSNGNYEKEEPVLAFSKDSIPYIDKKIFFQDSFEETKEQKPLPSESAMEIDEDALQALNKIEEVKEEKEELLNITRIFDNQYMPKQHLFREKESQEIISFLIKCVKERNYQSLIVAGQPGTGKTTVLTHLLEKLKEKGFSNSELIGEEKDIIPDAYEGINVLNINAAYCENLSPILLEVIKLVNERIPLSVSEYKNNSKLLVDKLKQILLAKKPKKLNVIAIDEIDSLLIKQNSAKEVAELLRIPNYPFSNVIFIIVSNHTDLISKLFDQHKVLLETDQVTFEPYSQQEMISIFKHRLKTVEKPLSETFEKKALDQINWDNCLKEMNRLKDTDIKHVFKIILKAYSNIKSAETQTKNDENNNAIVIDSNPLQLTEEDIRIAYGELYDEHLSTLFSSLSQKHLMCLASIITLGEKKKTTTFIKKDLLTIYNNLCPRLFLPKADLTILTELLSLFEVYNIVELKPKEVKETDTATKENTAKTPAKNANEEYIIKTPLEKVKETLKQDGYFANTFAE